GPAVINAGQLGYYRSLYTPKMLGALTRGFGGLQPIDQLGLVNDQVALSQAGYQQMSAALNLLRAVPTNANPVVARDAVFQWASLWRQLDGDTAGQAKLAAVAMKAWKPRLDALGL